MNRTSDWLLSRWGVVMDELKEINLLRVEIENGKRRKLHDFTASSLHHRLRLHWKGRPGVRSRDDEAYLCGLQLCCFCD
jgi:hypothetical protein